jgi:hypothetical protein
LLLTAIQKESVWAISWHSSPPFLGKKYASNGLEVQKKYVIVFMISCTKREAKPKAPTKLELEPKEEPEPIKDLS